MLEEYRQEQQIAEACKLSVFHERMAEAGLTSILDPKSAPRTRCAELKKSGANNNRLLDEQAHRAMIQAIARSVPAYVSGLRCWAAFCDASGVSIQFPATEGMVMRYCCMFACPATLGQYLKHLRWVINLILTQELMSAKTAIDPFLPPVARYRDGFACRDMPRRTN